MITLVFYIKFLKTKSKTAFGLKQILLNFLRTESVTYILAGQTAEKEKRFNSNINLIKAIIKNLNIDLSILFSERVSTSHLEEINKINLNHTHFSTQRTVSENYQLDFELVLLSKLLEIFMIKKYNKSLENISESLKNINNADFIMMNIYLNEEIYDLMNLAYNNFKDKYFWNFSEVLFCIYQKYPRILKYTILRHLKYSPSQESLLNQIIQYYYENKDYKKTKTLIRVINKKIF